LLAVYFLANQILLFVSCALANLICRL